MSPLPLRPPPKEKNWRRHGKNPHLAPAKGKTPRKIINDADVIDATGIDVYPGFVDAFETVSAKRKGGMDEEKRLSLPFVIEKSPYAKDSNPWFYEAIFMSDEVDPTFRLRESVTVEGMGIPLAGLAPRGGSRPHANVLKDNGNVHTLTAILDFDRMVDGKPTLRTIPRLMNEHIFIGKNKVRQPLAANFSVPIALFWKLSDADGTELLGAFRPKKAINTMGLYFSEPYDPRKIPVVFTHGLMSGPATFANLTNRLLVDPVIRENYQFWFFGYPSGLAWTIPASRQRQALKELMREYIR